METRNTIIDIKKKKIENRKIVALTAYDYPTANLVDEAGIDLVLVGDSLGMVVLGYETTLPVTMDEMIHHTKAVVRGCKKALIVADMPFLSYHTDINEAIKNAGRFIKEAGAQAVKLEGGSERVEAIKAIIETGIPLLGHLGLTPQSVHQIGGYKVQGKDKKIAEKIIKDAKLLQEAGCFALVLECVPALLAKLISEELKIPTIGIGAGPQCDGQILVIHDLLGINKGHIPKFVKKYFEGYKLMLEAIKEYKKEVQGGLFPLKEHSFSMEEENLPRVY